MGTVKPAVLAGFQCVIIKILITGDLALQGDIFSYIVAAPVEQKGSKQAAHSSVTVAERMDAQKIMDEHRN